MSVSGYKPSDVRNLTSDLMINWVKMSQSLEDDTEEQEEDQPTTPTSITCSAGYYLPANSTTCTTCPANNYCIGGTYSQSSSDQGLTPCSSGTTSPDGATSASQCQTSAPTTYTVTLKSTQFNKEYSITGIVSGAVLPNITNIDDWKQENYDFQGFYTQDDCVGERYYYSNGQAGERPYTDTRVTTLYAC